MVTPQLWQSLPRPDHSGLGPDPFGQFYGLLVEPTLFKRILDTEGQPLFAHEAKIRQAIAPDLAAQMVHLLRQAIDRGTGRQVRNLGFKRPAAGKTGTTNENTDAWFTGFTPTWSPASGLVSMIVAIIA